MFVLNSVRGVKTTIYHLRPCLVYIMWFTLYQREFIKIISIKDRTSTKVTVIEIWESGHVT